MKTIIDIKENSTNPAIFYKISIMPAQNALVGIKVLVLILSLLVLLRAPERFFI